MSKKREKKMDLKSAILLLLLLLALLISSTYAWFTSNRVVTVSDIKVKIEAQNGLQISANGVDWKAGLTTEDLEDAITSTGTVEVVNQLPATIEPVSTVGEVSNGYMKMFLGNVETNSTNEYVVSAEQTEAEASGVGTESTGKFVAFDIFLKVSEAQDNVILGKNSTVVYNDKVDDEDKGIENAARVAFLKQGTLPDDETATTSALANLLGADSLLTANQTSTYFWEPNCDTHKSAAIQNAANRWGMSLSQTGSDAVQYYGIKKDIATANAIKLDDIYTANDDYLTQIPTTSITSTSATMTDQDSFFSLDQGITKMRVYMWIEGQDVDCEDHASGSNIIFNLEFKLPEA